MGGQQGQLRLLPLHGSGVRLPHHLDVPEGPLAATTGEVEVVDAERLLEHRVVGLLAQRDQCLAVVEHVVAADLVRPVGQPGGMGVVGRVQEDFGAVGGAGRHHHDVRLVHLGVPARSTTTPVTVRPLGSVSSLVTVAPVSRVTLGDSRLGRTAMTSASALAWTMQG